MFIFGLFSNHVDRNVNIKIADSLGHKDDYLAFLKLCKEKNLRRHTYMIIRKDVPTDTSPECYTNWFGEFAHALGPNPWIFAPKL